jgi:tetratricopeptide (TPR) repeat protein
LRRAHLADRREAIDDEFDSLGSKLLAHYRELASIAFLRGDVNTSQAYLEKLLAQSSVDLTALDLLAQVHGFRGNLTEMRATYDRLRANCANDSSWQGLAWGQQGVIETTWRAFPSAAASLQRSLDCRERELLKAGETPESLRNVSVTLEKVGDLEREQGQTVLALARYRKSLEICERIVREFGETPVSLRGLGISLMKLGDMERAQGEMTPALTRYQRSLDICERVVREFGETREGLRILSISLDKVGDVEWEQRDIALALARYRRSLDIRERIVREFGETPESLADISMSLDRVGNVERLQGEMTLAQACYQRSLDINERIVRQFGETPESLRHLSISLAMVGDMERTLGETASAQTRYRRSLEICERIVGEFGETPESLRDVACAHWHVALCGNATNVFSAVRECWTRAMACYNRIFERGWGTPPLEKERQELQELLDGLPQE